MKAQLPSSLEIPRAVTLKSSMTDKELQRNDTAAKSSSALVNAVIECIPREGQKKQDDQDKGTPQNTKRHQWCNMEDYTFDINDIEPWFKLLV